MPETPSPFQPDTERRGYTPPRNPPPPPTQSIPEDSRKRHRHQRSEGTCLSHQLRRHHRHLQGILEKGDTCHLERHHHRHHVTSEATNAERTNEAESRPKPEPNHRRICAAEGTATTAAAQEEMSEVMSKPLPHSRAVYERAVNRLTGFTWKAE